MVDVLKIFYNPKKYFEERPKIWMVFGLVILFALIALLISAPVTFRAAVERTKELAEKTGKEIPIPEFSKYLSFLLLGALIGIPLKLLFQAFIYHMFLPFIEGEGTFSEAFLAVTSASLISSVANFLKAILIRVFNTVSIHFDLTVFFPSLPFSSRLYRLLSQIDIFTIWSLFVLSTGLSVLYHTEFKKSMILVLLLWIVYVFTLILLPVGGGML